MLFKNITNIIFPKTCLGCKKEGKYLCHNCLSVIEIMPYQYCLCEKQQQKIASVFVNGKCKECKNKKLDGLIFATEYKDRLCQKIIHNFKYPPLIRGLSEPLSEIMHYHLRLSGIDLRLLENFIIMPIPLNNNRQKWRGFNQSDEIAKKLKLLNTLLLNNVLIKNKKTKQHSLLDKNERVKNILDSFKINDVNKIKNQKILLIDDVYTTGSTMEECAKILKKYSVKKVLGMVIARNS